MFEAAKEATNVVQHLTPAAIRFISTELKGDESNRSYELVEREITQFSHVPTLREYQSCEKLRRISGN